MEHHSRSVRRYGAAPAATVIAFLVTLQGGPARAVDFLRGDVNNDGVVSLSDAHMLLNYEFRGGEPPTCWSAADVNGSESSGTVRIDIADTASILAYLFLRGDWRFHIPEPFPNPGPCVSLECDCESYGGVGPLEDPAAKLEIPDVVAKGGADTSAFLTVIVSSSRPLGGLSGKIRVPSGLVAAVGEEPEVLTKLKGGPLSRAFIEGEVITFGFLASYSPPFRTSASLQAGTNVEVLRIRLELEPGTPAGVYPLVIEDAELVDWESGRSIRPGPSSGLLNLAEGIPLVDVITFVRGDSNSDGIVDVSDPAFTFGALFLGGPLPSCPDAADADDSGEVDITDPLITLGFMFLNGRTLPSPYPEAGKDPTDDDLRCTAARN